MNIDDNELNSKINNIKNILDGKDEIIELIDICSPIIPESVIDANYSETQNKILQSIKESIDDLNLFSPDENQDENSNEWMKLGDVKEYLEDWSKNKLPDIIEGIVIDKMKAMFLNGILKEK
ncbi:MAG: hypothetical protein OEY79_01895 [Anaplasmataceae bacterium]|nr:hypothetical protein [Anaplasmataceae bacterium]